MLAKGSYGAITRLKHPRGFTAYDPMKGSAETTGFFGFTYSPLYLELAHYGVRYPLRGAAAGFSP